VSGKIKSLDELKVITENATGEGKTVVFTNGCFDLVHPGHVHLLRQAKALGDILIVAVNTDRSIKEIKGPNRPILPEDGRGALLTAMEMVDYVIFFDEPNPTRLIAALKPSVLVKGGDWGRDEVVGSEIVEKNGGRVELIPYLKGYSTTEIIERTQR
jgi:rfaE bifunctional protein nucleotidyltransferase chain/domain